MVSPPSKNGAKFIEGYEGVRVALFYRKRGPYCHSLERVFDCVRENLPVDIRGSGHYCPQSSKGFWPRLRNLVWAGKHQGDVNHITGDAHYLALALDKKRTILTVHDCAVLGRTRGLRHLLLWLFWFWIPEKCCSRITAVSEFTKKELIGHLGCSPEKIDVVYNPVFKGFGVRKKAFDDCLPVILQIGTGWNKNLETVVRALRGVNCLLEIVGPLNEEQQKTLQDSGITYRSHECLSDQALVDLYDGSDIVVFTSLYEGFGLPIIEAQASGKPVVTSNICAMPEVAGDGAMLVDPHNSAAIREAILRIISDKRLRDELVQKGYNNISRFDASGIAEQYAAIYRQIFKGT